MWEQKSNRHLALKRWMQDGSPMALLMVLAVVAISPAYSQQSAAEDQLQIEVTEGEDAVHQNNERTGKNIEVKVTDEKQRPVQGAIVAFSSPPFGRGARFVNDALTIEVPTDEQGRARVTGVRGNNVAGNYTIRMVASFEGKTGRAEVAQRNQKPRKVTTKRTLLAGAISAAVVIPLVVLHSPAPPKASISTITPSGPVGAP